MAGKLRYKQYNELSEDGRAPRQMPKDNTSVNFTKGVSNRATIVGPVLWPPAQYEKTFKNNRLQICSRCKRCPMAPRLQA